MNTFYLFGDSVLKGVTFSAEKNAYSIHRRKLELPEGAALVNRAVFGATAPKVYAELEKRLPMDAEGDTVIFSFGGNDSDHDWNLVSMEPEKEHSPKTPASEFSDCFVKCVELARSRGAKVLASSLVPIDAARFMARISRGLSRENILRWLGDESMLYRWHEHYDGIIRRLTGEMNVPLIDLREPFLLSHDFRGLLSADGIHPTERGHCLIDGTLSGALAL